MLNDYFVENISALAMQIDQHGIAIMDNFLPLSTLQSLANETLQLHQQNLMQPAGTGRGQKSINQSLRGDHIYWLDEQTTSPAQQAYFSGMEAIRQLLNQQLYLGIFALESHLALYQAGTRYRTHIDRFKGAANGQPLRQISCILYLNQDWHDSCGGHLRLYLTQNADTPSIPTEQSAHIDILPTAGRLVMFLSDTFYHEVLPATQARMSLTGWFLTR